MRRALGVAPVVVVSEDAEASSRIAAFTRGTEPWLVAVRMVSEGVDIPRLRVGVFATTTTTELFFRQAVGRLVRWTRGLGAQPSYMFIPGDGRLLGHALQITAQRRHSLRRVDDDGTVLETDPAELDDPVEREVPEGQLSLFEALSAVPTGEPEVHHAPGTLFAPHHEEDEEGVVLDLAPAPALAGVPVAEGEPPRPGRLREYRQELRDANAALTRQIARITGLSHAQVNLELNRRVGVGKVGEATIDQLERRRVQARGWLATA
jgi:hypothetical protein